MLGNKIIVGGVSFVELGGLEVGEGAIDKLLHHRIGGEGHLAIALDSDALARVDIYAVAVANLLQLEGAETFDLHHAIGL